MGAFLLSIIGQIAIIAAVLAVLGFALAPHFKSVGKPVWKAFVPVYNIFSWANLTKNSFVFAILALWWIPLPLWWMVTIGIGAYVILVLDTRQELYEKVPYYWLIVLAAVAIGGTINFIHDYYTIGEGLTKADFGGMNLGVVFGVISMIYNGIVLLAGFLMLFSWGRGSKALDSERYFSKEFSFKQYAIQQFKRNKPALISTYVIGALVLLAVFAPYIANDQPIFAKYRGQVYFPAHTSVFNPNRVDSVINEAGNSERLQFDITNWKTLKLDNVVWAPVTFSPGVSDRYSRDYVGPFGDQRYKNPEGEIVASPRIFRHHLGTDAIGSDLLSGLIHGTRIALVIGLISMGIATLIGIILGSIAGYFGDSGLRAPRLNVYLIFAAFCLFLFYWSMTGAGGFARGFGLLVLTSLVLLGMGKAGIKFPGWFGKQTDVPVDTIVYKMIEILNSLPRLLIIITLSAIYGRSMLLLMVIIGATSWTGIARFTRAEFLRTRSLEYIDAAKSLGYSQARVIFRHALPNSLAPVFVSIAFGIASAILAESTLSFLGIGVPDDVVTWGQLLSKGRLNFEASWLVWFPGLAIFVTVTVYNLIGEALRDALDPKLKQ